MGEQKANRGVCAIRDVRVEYFDWEAESFTALDERGTVDTAMRNGLLRLQCEHDLEGQCLLGGMGQDPSIWGNQIDLVFRPLILGFDFTEREGLWARLPRLTGHSPSLRPGWAAVDVALWDLAGKHYGVPVVDLLGRARPAVPAYATHPPLYAEIDDLIEDVTDLRDAGIGLYKLHPGPTPIGRVIEFVHALRDTFGDDFGLILDPANRYSLPEAVRIGRVLDSLGFLWLEDPIAVGEEPQAIELARRIATPVALTDSAYFGLKSMARLAGTGHFSVLRGSSRWMGITGLKRACSLMEGHGGFCEVGLGGNPSMNVANLHVMQSVVNARYYEHWLPAGRHEFGTTAPPRPREGVLSVTALPGLGVELDEAWLSDHRV